ncbi:metal ABC transporter ATP-binding protein [Anaerocolumna cellulosilytica]|nr:metal ABC transporter ATP-binding protein [Anaerocolumna cellulosilytica]MBB5195112.1 zinc transport system ATP-binding protein [Anaerocolumna cellulosilytica]
MNHIVLNHVSFGYEEGFILEDVNLTIEKGDYAGIIGPNGTGKSTLIKLILGLLPAKNGKVLITGGRIGYVPQVGLAVKADFPATVLETVMLNLYPDIGLFKRPKKHHFEMAEKVLDLVGMNGYKNRLISKLSGGQQQRVLIAKSLVSQPDILILDEPIAGVDSESEEKFYSLLLRLNREEKLTIVMVTHNIHNVSKDMNKIYEVNNKSVRLKGELPC